MAWFVCYRVFIFLYFSFYSISTFSRCRYEKSLLIRHDIRELYLQNFKSVTPVWTVGWLLVSEDLIVLYASYSFLIRFCQSTTDFRKNVCLGPHLPRTLQINKKNIIFIHLNCNIFKFYVGPRILFVPGTLQMQNLPLMSIL